MKQLLRTEHPEVIWISRTGYPADMQPKNRGTDSLGIRIFAGDELLVLDDEKFVKEELSFDALQILKILGAESEVAK